MGKEHKTKEVAKIYTELYHSILHGPPFETKIMIFV